MADRDVRGHRLGVVLAGAVWGWAVTTGGIGGVEAAGVAFLVGAERYRTIGGLVGSIATGAVVLGVVAWLAAGQTTAVPVSSGLAAGLGVAVGGGLGSVVWLLTIEDEETDTTETVTVDMGEADDAAPAPEPVDLFEASPDPILFYTEGEGGPVVRAVNPAFLRVFGVSETALDGVPLGDGVLAAERGADVVSAARAGDPFDETVACETDGGQRRMRLRIAATGRERADGYVLYTPVEAGP